MLDKIPSNRVPFPLTVVQLLGFERHDKTLGLGLWVGRPLNFAA
jgi:hypothetical protein